MGLRSGDLENLIDHIFEIDSYASKMGDDKNIVTLSFSLKTNLSADDLVSFIEKGYSFVLDADATSGEQSDGTYKVFVEIERNKNIPDEIMEIIDGVKKLSNLDEFKFRYYKNFRSVPATLENIKQSVPIDPDEYGLKKKEATMENYKEFFNRSYLETIEMYDDIIHMKKAYADPIQFKFIDIGQKTSVIENINETINVNCFAEIIFLSKYIGDYNITKFGDKLTFENENHVLVAERIVV